jgi:hypothetical protein
MNPKKRLKLLAALVLLMTPHSIHIETVNLEMLIKNFNQHDLRLIQVFCFCDKSSTTLVGGLIVTEGAAQ